MDEGEKVRRKALGRGGKGDGKRLWMKGKRRGENNKRVNALKNVTCPKAEPIMSKTSGETENSARVRTRLANENSARVRTRLANENSARVKSKICN